MAQLNKHDVYATRLACGTLTRALDLDVLCATSLDIKASVTALMWHSTDSVISVVAHAVWMELIGAFECYHD